MSAADVAIIGGGIVGTASAYFLARDGHRVALLEQGEIGSGTASASGGWVILQDKDEPAAFRLALESRRLYDHLAEDAGVRRRVTGGLIVAGDPEELAALALQRDRAAPHVRVELLDGRELRDLEPGLAPNLPGALYCPDEAVVDPVQVCRALAQRAGGLGARIMLNEEVTAIDIEEDRVAAVRTTRGRVATRVLICAAGAWTADLARTVGVNVPIRPRRGHLARTDERLVTRPVLEAGYLQATDSGAEGQGIRFVMQPLPDGGCVVGSSREFAGFNREPDPGVIEAIWSRASRYVPALDQRAPGAVTVGLRPYCALGRPVIAWAGPRGFLVAAGHEGEGITLGPITGKLVADLVAGRVAGTGYDL